MRTAIAVLLISAAALGAASPASARGMYLHHADAHAALLGGWQQAYPRAELRIGRCDRLSARAVVCVVEEHGVNAIGPFVFDYAVVARVTSCRHVRLRSPAFDEPPRVVRIPGGSPACI